MRLLIQVSKRMLINTLVKLYFDTAVPVWLRLIKVNSDLGIPNSEVIRDLLTSS